MRTLAVTLLLAAASALAWFAWQPPQPPLEKSRAVRTALPGDDANERWRVVTRKLAWREAAESMRTRLEEAGLSPQLFVRREATEMHVFDDRRHFDDYAEAVAAREAWRKRGVEADVLEAPKREGFIVGLGRFYLTAYAEQMQARLKRLGEPYRYQRRTVKIPAYRFTFAPLPEEEAQTLWQRIQKLGIAEPSLLTEEKFRQLYGEVPGEGEEASKG